MQKAQSNLIIPNPITLANLPTLIQEVSGFFIVENYVLETTGTFRSARDVEELWNDLVNGLTTGIDNALSAESDPDIFLKTKECLVSFLMTLEVRPAYICRIKYNKPFRHLILQDLCIHSCCFFSRSMRNCSKPSLVTILNL